MSESSSEEPEPFLNKKKNLELSRSPRTSDSRRAVKKSKKTKKNNIVHERDSSPKDSSSEHSTSSSDVEGTEAVLDDFLKREEEDFVDDASCLVSEFQKAYCKVSNGLRKPNVLVTGITGAGKSSIINAVFGKNVAKTAAGYPVTQHFVKYSSDDMRVVIYDSKGLEHGEFENFIDTTRSFFDQHHSAGEDAIHAIWYIVNCAHSRWEPFEERMCRELFSKAPLIFILNKADLSSEEDRQRIRTIIADMALPNCVGVFDTVAVSDGSCQTISACSNCGSDDIVIRKKTATIYCESCQHQDSTKHKSGLDEVITTTCKFLPEVVHEAFISAQTVSYHLKEAKAHKVIDQFWDEYENIRTPGGLLKAIAKMMARLSIVWEFKQHGQLYGDLWARDLVSHLKWKDKVNLLFHKKMEHQKVHIAAVGILWNRCLRNLAVGLLQEFSATLSCSENNMEDENGSELSNIAHKPCIDQTVCTKFFRKYFTEFNEDNLCVVEEDIRTTGLQNLMSSDILGDLTISPPLSTVTSRNSSLNNSTSILRNATTSSSTSKLRCSGGQTHQGSVSIAKSKINGAIITPPLQIPFTVKSTLTSTKVKSPRRKNSHTLNPVPSRDKSCKSKKVEDQ